MMLPLSLPASPFDLEADIAQGLEQLRNSPVDVVQPITWPAVTETKEAEHKSEEQPSQQRQQVIDDIFSTPFSPTFPSHSPTSPYINNNEEKVLKSRWSSSTLGSIREEHERQGASAKLRLYFAGHSPLKSSNNNSNTKQGSNKKTSMHSPVPSLSPRGRKAAPPAVPPSPAFSTASTTSSSARSPSKAARRAHHLRGYSDVMVIGYGNNGNNNNNQQQQQHGMRRRGSVTNSVSSDAGSEESTSSTSSSGLRRKPIPVEMFLRSAV